jgi:hypothetical protein
MLTEGRSIQSPRAIETAARRTCSTTPAKALHIDPPFPGRLTVSLVAIGTVCSTARETLREEIVADPELLTVVAGRRAKKTAAGLS